jgi:hypothetical protein
VPKGLCPFQMFGLSEHPNLRAGIGGGLEGTGCDAGHVAWAAEPTWWEQSLVGGDQLSPAVRKPEAPASGHIWDPPHFAETSRVQEWKAEVDPL